MIDDLTFWENVAVIFIPAVVLGVSLRLRLWVLRRGGYDSEGNLLRADRRDITS